MGSPFAHEPELNELLVTQVDDLCRKHSALVTKGTRHVHWTKANPPRFYVALQLRLRDTGEGWEKRGGNQGGPRSEFSDKLETGENCCEAVVASVVSPVRFPLEGSTRPSCHSLYLHSFQGTAREGT